MPSKLHEHTARELAGVFRSCEASAVEIVEAFSEQADRTEPQINGFTHRLHDKALDTAIDLDRRRSKGEELPTLAGVPVTIKDNIDFAGVPTTLGLKGRSQHCPTRDAVLVSVLRKAGALLIGKSNVPQALISGIRTANPLFGETKNPWSPGHGTGGSSGGEAALIASRASVLGIGTDLGGSIRTPATYCGVVGMKPTSHRWSNLGVLGAMPGQDGVRPQAGPLARNVSDLEFLFASLDLAEQSRADVNVPPLTHPDSVDVDIRGLRVGFYEHDGYFTPSLGCARAAGMARSALEDAGAIVVDFPLKDQLEIVQLHLALLGSDGMQTMSRLLQGEELDPTVKRIQSLARLPEGVRRLAGRLLANPLGDRFISPRALAVMNRVDRSFVDRLWELQARRDQIRAAELLRWNRMELDALLGPATATPAPPLTVNPELSVTFGYTGRYNLFGFPVGVLPVDVVRPEECHRPAQTDNLDRIAADVDDQSAGLPVGAQIVARPWREHHAFALMRAIEDGVSFSHVPC